MCTKGTIPTTMYLHSRCFTAGVSIPSMGLLTPMYLHSLFHCMGSIPCVGDLFALRALSPPPCTYIHCMGFSSLHGSPPLPCTYIHCMGFNSLHGSPPLPCTYIHYMDDPLHQWHFPHPHVPTFTVFTVLLHGFNSLCGFPPVPYTYIDCVHCIHCILHRAAYCLGVHFIV